MKHFQLTPRNSSLNWNLPLLLLRSNWWTKGREWTHPFRLGLLAFASCLSLLYCDSVIAQTPDRQTTQFQRLDRDNDGFLTAEELGRPNLHRQADKDGDGKLTIDEVRDFLQRNRFRAPVNPGKEPSEVVGEFSDQMPFSLESCRAAAEYSTSAAGHALIVMHNGKIVYERYDNGWSAETPHRLASGTKSFAGVVAAAAVDDGILHFDEKVSDTIVEWQEDERLQTITVRQLLSLCSGIEPGDNGRVLDYGEAIKAKAIDDAGKRFRYGPNAFQVFGLLINRKIANRDEQDADKDYLVYLTERILDPIGMSHGPWRRTTQDEPHVPSGAHVSAREWAKFGQLLCSHGAWEGEQLVKPESLDELTKPSEANPRYGLTFWLNGEGNTRSPQQIPADLFQASGAGKQRLYVIPSMNLVVVRFGETEGRRFVDSAFLSRLLNKPSGDERD